MNTYLNKVFRFFIFYKFAKMSEFTLFALEFAKEGVELVLWDCNTAANEQNAKLARELGPRRTPTRSTARVPNVAYAWSRPYSAAPHHRGTNKSTFANPISNVLFIGHLLFTPQDYCASKFGAGQDGIKTTLVCPYIVDTSMFAGAAGFDSPLDTMQTAMAAILGDKHMISIPCFMYPELHKLLPWEANVATYRFMGGDKCMLPFIKTMAQKAATTNSHAKSS
uniref:Uncharacterized protein n=1 Tax=Hucho hucho TaxID=62062 RepID=A0A4W5K0S6_9TELE